MAVNFSWILLLLCNLRVLFAAVCDRSRLPAREQLAWDVLANSGWRMINFGCSGDPVQHITEIWQEYASLSGSIPSQISYLSNLTVLHIPYNNLNGTLPPELSLLPELRILNANVNKLSGPIPADYGNFAKLQEFNGWSNDLDGTIPLQLANIRSLVKLAISHNSLTGTIPAILSALPLLEELYLNSNLLTGTIPPEFGNSTSLILLNLESNDLEGTLPKELGKLNNLQYLSLGYNRKLIGTLPAEFGDMSSLSRFYMPLTKISGSIPPEIGNCPLNELFLMNNQFDGNIPTTLKDISLLDFGSNLLTGTIPDNIFSPTLSYLSLAHNKLTGSIPESIGRAINAVNINFNDNELTGTLPTNISALTSCKTFYALANSLTGTLPTSLVDLPNLSYLWLNYNGFSGTIPVEFGNFPMMQSLGLSYNDLEGSIPVELCGVITLDDLNLENNQLNGTIPPEIGYLNRLRVLNIGHNQFTGRVPVEAFANLTALILFGLHELLTIDPWSLTDGIANLPNLRRIVLWSSNLVDPLPSVLGPNLRDLYIYNNPGLTTLTDAIVLNNNLDIIDISFCGFQGEYPAVWSQSFVTFDTNTNNFYGNLPVQVSSMPFLQSLVLHHNNLTGPLPEDWSNSIAKLVYLSDNPLGGSIPPSFAAVPTLTEIYLPNCGLTGPLPEVWTSTSMWLLHIYSNPLSGPLPAALANHPSLTDLLAQDCNLDGTLPEDWSNSVLQRIYLKRNPITGTLPASFAKIPTLVEAGLGGMSLTGKLPYRWTSSIRTLWLYNALFEGALPPLDYATTVDITGSNFTSATRLLDGVCLYGAESNPNFCLPPGMRVICSNPPICNCEAGFVGRDCSDFDECWAEMCGLNTQCTNTYGSFVCNCLPGFIWNPESPTDCTPECPAFSAGAPNCQCIAGYVGTLVWMDTYWDGQCVVGGSLSVVIDTSPPNQPIINRDQPLRLQARTLGVTAYDKLHITWTVNTTPLSSISLDLANPNNLLSTPNSLTLVLKPSLLNYTTYQFTIKITVNNTQIINQTIAIEVNQPPTTTSCTASPSSVEVMADPVVLSCNPWTDTDGLSAVYYTYRAAVQMNAVRTLLGDGTIPVFLPVGVWIIEGCARDELGAVGCVDAGQVSITQPTSTPAGCVALAANSTILADALATNQYDRALQTMQILLDLTQLDNLNDSSTITCPGDVQITLGDLKKELWKSFVEIVDVMVQTSLVNDEVAIQTAQLLEKLAANLQQVDSSSNIYNITVNMVTLTIDSIKTNIALTQSIVNILSELVVTADCDQEITTLSNLVYLLATTRTSQLIDDEQMVALLSENVEISGYKGQSGSGLGLKLNQVEISIPSIVLSSVVNETEIPEVIIQRYSSYLLRCRNDSKTNVIGDIVSIDVAVGGDKVSINSTFSFPITVPISSTAELGCQTPSCAWWDPVNLVWSTQGCSSDGVIITQADGSRAYRCSCTHLTAFAAILQEQNAGCAQAKIEWLYVGIAIAYGIVLMWAVIQSILVLRERKQLFTSIMFQHGLLSLMAALRMISTLRFGHAIDLPLYLIAIVTAPPFIIAFVLFSFNAFHWAGLYHFALQGNPFLRVRPIYIISNIIIALVIIFLFIAIVQPEFNANQVALAGSIILSFFSTLLALLLLIYGMGVISHLTNSNTGGLTALRRRLLTIAGSVCFCLIGESIMWMLSVTIEDNSSSNKNGTSLDSGTLFTGLFYLFDVMLIVILLVSFSRLAQRDKSRLSSSGVSREGTTRDSNTSHIELSPQY